jgi:hypothetical protein
MALNKAQLAALGELSADGFRVNWRPKLSASEYEDLRTQKLIEEQWTWASTTRPDVRLSDVGVSALTRKDP